MKAIAVFPMVQHALSIHVQTETIICRRLDPVAARYRRQELAGPADAEAIVRNALPRCGFAPREQVVRRRTTIPAEADLGVGTDQCRRPREIRRTEVFTAQATFR
ncbi:hypothetical protein D3C71_1039750 [compost metagenome]